MGSSVAPAELHLHVGSGTHLVAVVYWALTWNLVRGFQDKWVCYE